LCNSVDGTVILLLLCLLLTSSEAKPVNVHQWVRTKTIINTLAMSKYGREPRPHLLDCLFGW